MSLLHLNRQILSQQIKRIVRISELTTTRATTRTKRKLPKNKSFIISLANFEIKRNDLLFNQMIYNFISLLAQHKTRANRKPLEFPTK